jgi:hypothetical protein
MKKSKGKKTRPEEEKKEASNHKPLTRLGSKTSGEQLLNPDDWLVARTKSPDASKKRKSDPGTKISVKKTTLAGQKSP